MLLGMLLCFILTFLLAALARGTTFRHAVLEYLALAFLVLCGVPFVALTPTHWISRVLFAVLSVIANICIAVIFGFYWCHCE